MSGLNQWTGRFEPGQHRYFRADGKELQGVTGILKSMLFKDEYKGVSAEVLANAAQRGSMIHSRLELYDNSGIGTDMPEVRNYARLKEEYNLEYVDSEYLVSDDENIASAIDKVFHEKGAPEDVYDIGDIKTTYNFNREYVSWQLSVYAYLFELLNPEKRIGRLLGIWVREDRTRGSIARIFVLERKPAELVKELLTCYLEGREFKAVTIPTFIAERMDELMQVTEQIKRLTEIKDGIVKEILTEMHNRNEKSIDAGLVLFTRQEASTKSTFDSAKFKVEHSDLYNEYLKKSETKECLKVTIRE